MKRNITLKLAGGEKKYYKTEDSGGKCWVYRYSGGFFSRYDPIGTATSFALALDLIKSDAGGSVADTKIEDS